MAPSNHTAHAHISLNKYLLSTYCVPGIQHLSAVTLLLRTSSVPGSALSLHGWGLYPRYKPCGCVFVSPGAHLPETLPWLLSCDRSPRLLPREACTDSTFAAGLNARPGVRVHPCGFDSPNPRLPWDLSQPLGPRQGVARPRCHGDGRTERSVLPCCLLSPV